MINNFKIALSKRELPDYFRGKGEYFTRDPDWGTQLHIINWQGLCAFLKTSSNAEGLLKTSFGLYVNSVILTKDDANDLLENIGCYYYLRNKSSILSENGFDLIRDADDENKRKISEVMRFLKKEMSANNNVHELELFNRRMRRLLDDGGPADIENL